MTGLELVTGSARLIKVLASGEAMSNNEAQDALSSLNQMIDSWSNENLLIFQSIEDDLVLTSGQQSYTMGTGGDFNTPRPQEILRAVLRITTLTPNYDIPMEIINNDQWANIQVKTMASTLPQKLYVEYSYPLATIQIWPKPTAGNTLVLYSLKPLTTVSTLNTVLSLPPGYLRALRYNLAVEMAPEFGVSIDPVVVAQAIESKEVLKRSNSKPLYLSTDEALVSSGSGFNYLIGE